MVNEYCIDLAGQWHMRLDEDNIGISAAWQRQILTAPITLPGTLQGQGYGHAVTAQTHFVEGLHDRLWFLRQDYAAAARLAEPLVPFISQPLKHYLGVCWYQKAITIPAHWQNMVVQLHLERVRWQSHVWLDDQDCGVFDSLCVPHDYVLGVLTPGRHMLTVRVDNTMLYPYRPDAHGVSDSEGDTWNGIAGAMTLQAKSQVMIAGVQVYPNTAAKTVKVAVNVSNYTNSVQSIQLKCICAPEGNPASLDASSQAAMHQVKPGMSTCVAELVLPKTTQLWDEFQPALQALHVSIDSPWGSDRDDVTFGMRTITTQGTKFVLNQRPIALRGTHDAGGFPLTGAPACDLATWRKIMQTCKRWGLNHIRYHSWCPPEAAFVAADELGLYLQIETGMWNYFIPGGVIEAQLRIETQRILAAYGNHPSFVMLSSGNEPHGAYGPVLAQWVKACRQLDPRHLYTVQSGWFWPKAGQSADQTDYVYTSSRGDARMRGVSGWFGKDYSGHMQDLHTPFVAHELGQWTAYPDFALIAKFTGYMRPGNYQIFRQSALAHGVLAQNAAFVKASGLLQQLCYKEDIEANLRTHEYSGYSLLDLHDYLGQGGALVGMLDAFWDEKPYADAAFFRQFCAPVVPLVRLAKYTYTNAETISADVEVYCYAAQSLAAEVTWQVTDDSGRTVKQGTFGQQQLPTGQNTPLGTLTIALADLPTPATYQLVVSVAGTTYHNSWQLWVYPDVIVADPQQVLLTHDLPEALAAVDKGRRVLFMPRKEQLDYNCPPMATEPVFWNSQMGPKWARSLGLWCEPKHPALAEFPTACGMQWQWRQIIEDTRAINVEGLPAALQPLVQPIDDWNRNDKLALVFECRVGAGSMLVSAIDFTADSTNAPAKAQLFKSLLTYMNSDAFAPTVPVTPAALQSFLFDTTVMTRLHAQVTVDQPAASADVAKLLAGDPNTYWLAGGNAGGQYPFTLTFTTPQAVVIRGLNIMPRQNHRSLEGAPKHYQIAVCGDGQTWHQVAQGVLPAAFAPTKVWFDQPERVTQLRLTLLDGFGVDDLFYWQEDHTGFHSQQGPYHDPYAALAEVAYLLAEPLDLPKQAISVAYADVKTASAEIY